MNGFLLKDHVLTVEDNVWGLLPFKKILKRDKSRDKDRALKEMLFIYYYCDIKSDYLIIDSKFRKEEIIKDIGLPEDWKIDSIMQEAIDFYEERSLTVVGKLYKNALLAANDISEYLTKTKELLEERDDKGKPVTTLTTIVGGISKIKVVMQDLKAAEKVLIKERIETEGKMKGQQQMGMFENGLTID
jgi:hypothetical protein